MKRAKYIFLCSACLLLPFQWGWAINSNQTGDWSNTSTWVGGVVPTSSDSVTILSGHTVTVDTTGATSGPLFISGALKFSRTVSSTLTMVGGDVVVNGGGHLDMGTSGDAVPSTVKATLILALGSMGGEYGLINSVGGTFTVYGAEKSLFGFASSDALAGSTNVSLPASSMVGWAVGDEITLSQSRYQNLDETERRTITSISGIDPKTISWAGGLLYPHTSNGYFLVTNLTRNVLVRSSGTVTTGASTNTAYIDSRAENVNQFNLVNGEFSHIGTDTAWKTGVMALGPNSKIFVSSSTFHDGYRGVYPVLAKKNTVQYSVFYKNVENISGSLSGENDFIGNHIYSSTVGIRCVSACRGDRYISNYIYSTSDRGVLVAGTTDKVIFSSNTFFGNKYSALESYSPETFIISNTFFGNYYAVIGFPGSTNMVLYNNIMYSQNQSAALLVEPGIILLGNYMYSNQGGGVHVQRDDIVSVDNIIGYDVSGLPSPNLGTYKGIYLDPGGTASVRSYGDRIHPSEGVPSDGLDAAGKSVITFNKDNEVGTIRVWGDALLNQETLDLSYANRLYRSTATTPIMQRGDTALQAHAAQVLSTDDSSVRTEYVTVTNAGGNSWDVRGSSSGVFGTIMGNPGVAVSQNFGPFVFELTQGLTTSTGDLLSFFLMAASDDANQQKRLLFQESNAGFNSGSAKLTVPANAGLSLTGTSFDPVLVDRAGINFFDLDVSGSFSVLFTTFSNLGPRGVEFSGTPTVSMSSVTFDNIGTLGGQTISYITVRDLNSTAIFNNIAFNLSRSTSGTLAAYNVRVEGVDTSLDWAFQDSTGPFSGILYEYDPNGRLRWDSFPPLPVTNLVSVPGGSDGEVDLTWTFPGDNFGTLPLTSGSRYLIQHSTDPAAVWSSSSAQVSISTSGVAPSSSQKATVGGLFMETTYYFRLWSADNDFNFSPESNLVQTVPRLGNPNVLLGPVALSLPAISRSQTFTATFSKPVNATSVQSSFGLVLVRNNVGTIINTPVSGTVIVDGSRTVFTLTPSAVLEGNSLYRIVMSTNAVDDQGNAIPQEVSLEILTVMDYSTDNVYIDPNQGDRVSIPAYAFASDGYIVGTPLNSSDPAVSIATQKNIQNTGDPIRNPIENTLLDLKVYNDAGSLQTGVFSSPVTLTLNYVDTNDDGIIDGSNPPVLEKTLNVHWLDETNNIWVPLSSTVDTTLNQVSASVPHFTTFALIGQNDVDLSNVYAFPSPFRAARGDSSITFTGLGQLVTIQIYTVSGQLVTEITPPISGAGQYIWGVTNKGGTPLKSGVYFYRITSGSQSKKGKMVIIR